MFARILVPLDGSVSAEEALPVAARIVRASRGSIHLLTVVGPLIDLAGEYDVDPLLSEQRIETETTVATDYLRTIANLSVLDRIQITTEVAPGLPAQYILAAAKLGGGRSHCAEQPRQDGFHALGAGQRCAYAGA